MCAPAILSHNYLCGHVHLRKNRLDNANKHCSYNELTALPQSIGELCDLRVLKCEHNQLTKLPDSINRLGSLDEAVSVRCSRAIFTAFFRISRTMLLASCRIVHSMAGTCES